MAITGIHHVSIATKDLELMLGFYRDLTGFPIVYDAGWGPGQDRIDAMVGLRGSSARVVLLHGRNLYIELFQYHTPEVRPLEHDRPVCDPGLTHLCLMVDDIDAEYLRLTGAGIRFHAPPGPPAAFRAVYGRDPEGNVFELIQFLQDHPFASSRLGAAVQ